MNDTEEDRLAAASAEIDRLRAETARLAEENRAFLAAMRHMTSAADRVLEEARQEAADTRARAAAEAYERLVVARADARDAVLEERQRAAAEFELLAAVRERVTTERLTMTHFQGELNTHLRRLVHSVLAFTDEAPVLETAVPAAVFREPIAEPVPVVVESIVQVRAPKIVDGHPLLDVEGHTLTDLPAIAVDHAILDDPAADADAELEQAFEEFFGDIDVEPSRRWILSD